MKLQPLRSRFSLLLLALLTATGLVACNLVFDLEDYPYPLPYRSPDAAFPDGDVPDAEDDAGSLPGLGPRLLMTELMIRPTPAPGTGIEGGEFIEIFNAGDVAIHPRSLVIEILETNDRIYIDRLVSSPQEQEAVSALRPIEPGEYFLFLRHDHTFYEITTDLEEGTFYEYGRWHRDLPLPNSTATVRLLELRQEFDVYVHHELGWREGSLVDLEGRSSVYLDIRQDIAFGLRPGILEPHEATRPENWCYHVHRFSSGPLLGSPGSPTPDSCL